MSKDFKNEDDSDKELKIDKEIANLILGKKIAKVIINEN
jgi:hypothetical protein